MNFKWDDETTLLLIEKFRENEMLWKRSHPDHKSRTERIKGLKQLASLFGPNLDSSEIERKLKNLTSHYHRERKKFEETKRTSPSELVSEPKWFAYKALDFLRLKTKPRKRGSYSGPVKVKTRKKSSNHEENSSESLRDAKERSSTTRDDASIFGEFIASKIRRMDPVTTSTVEHLIQNIIYQAEMGVYGQIPAPSTISPAYFAASTLRRPSCESNFSLNEVDANSEP